MIWFSIQDALLTRLSNDDDLEKSLSTFANEMASTAMILGYLFSTYRMWGLMPNNVPVF